MEMCVKIMNVAKLFVKCLENEEVEHIFGLPGEELREVMFAIEKSNIDLIVTRHEQGAAFMADVYGRVKGKSGVCLSTLGPGATNLVTGVADANLDHAPLVAITAQGNIDRLHKESHQIIDIVDLFRPITKWNARIASRHMIAEAVRKAFKVAEMEKPGATHLELPEDVAAREITGEPLRRIKVRRGAADYKALTQAVHLITQSKHPLILAGNGAIRKLASNHLRTFVEKTGIPVLSTFMGKGAISDEEEKSLMSFGLGTSSRVFDVIKKADLIITVGYDIAELEPKKWNMGNKKIVHIDFSTAEVNEFYQPEVEIVADISNTFWALNKQIKKQFKFAEAEIYRKRLVKDVLGFSNDGYPLHPKHALITLRKMLHKDALLVSDVGSHKMWVGSAFPTYERGSVIISNGFASMGIAVPGAIGAKLAAPDREVVAVCGDGGFLMNVQEFETAKRINVDFTTILFNDDSYSLIEAKFRADANRTFGTDITNPDFRLLSESFGCKYWKVEKTNELEAVYEEALKAKGRKIVEVPIDKKKNMELFK